MEKSTELQQLINASEILVETNSHLVRINEEALQLTNKNIRQQEKLLAHCGKIYQLLQPKINKTWEEDEVIKILYHLITHKKE